MLRGYMRISTHDGRQRTHLQMDALLAAGVDRDYIYCDQLSGALDRRSGLDQLLADLQEGDTLIVWKLDRLGRSLSHLITIVDGLTSRGIGFRSLTEAMDTTTPGGKLLLHIFGALAQYERSLTIERINAGIAAARKRGKKLGRPYRVSGDQIATARELIEAGSSIRQAARSVGAAPSSLCYVLKTRST